jgi:hypothetical protein
MVLTFFVYLLKEKNKYIGSFLGSLKMNSKNCTKVASNSLLDFLPLNNQGWLSEQSSTTKNETLYIGSRREKSRACYISQRRKTDVLTKNNKYWQKCKMMMYLINNIHTSEKGPRLDWKASEQ